MVAKPNDPSSPPASTWSFAKVRGDVPPKPPYAFLPRDSLGSPAKANEERGKEKIAIVEEADWVKDDWLRSGRS